MSWIVLNVVDLILLIQFEFKKSTQRIKEILLKNQRIWNDDNKMKEVGTIVWIVIGFQFLSIASEHIKGEIEENNNSSLIYSLNCEKALSEIFWARILIPGGNNLYIYLFWSPKFWGGAWEITKHLLLSL